MEIRFSISRSRALLSGWIVILFCAALVGGSVPAAEPKPSGKTTLDQYLKGLGYGVIPLQRGEHNNLFVKGAVDGRKAVLLVDTGASLLSLDRRLAGKLKPVSECGVEVTGSALGKNSREDAVLIRELRLRETRFSNQPASPLPLKVSGLPYDGILGADFLIRQRAILDCAGKWLFVRDTVLDKEKRKSLKAAMARSGYHEAPLSRTPGLLLGCQVRINKLDVDLIVDTGAVYTMIDADTANRCQVLWSQTNVKVDGIGSRGAVLLWRGTPDVFRVTGAQMLSPNLSIGACEMASWEVGVKRPGAEELHGVLGSDLLGTSNAVIDFDSATLWFVPPEAHAK